MIDELKGKIPDDVIENMSSGGITKLRSAQLKALKKGLLDRKNMLVCTPTASGKTLIAEIAASNSIININGKVIYVVPLKALASEKYREFKKKYKNIFRVALSIGDLDSSENRLAEYDLIICTSEKLDSLIRHKSHWLRDVSTLVIDEIHLLNDTSRGPTLEIVITTLRQMIPHIQILGLSATIGNPEELAQWLNAELVIDNWRPVKLHKGIYMDGEIEFFDE